MIELCSCGVVMRCLNTKADSDTSPKKKTTSPKTKTVQVTTEESTQKSKRVKRPAKKPTAVAQQKKTMERSKTDFHGSRAGGSGTDEGTGYKPGVPDVPKYDFESDKESWGNNEEEDDDNVGIRG
ncbi:hypothetical protein Tco_0471832 [Tanacetum coccineum]